jgi:hypothetical protein
MGVRLTEERLLDLAKGLGPSASEVCLLVEEICTWRALGPALLTCPSCNGTGAVYRPCRGGGCSIETWGHTHQEQCGGCSGTGQSRPVAMALGVIRYQRWP